MPQLHIHRAVHIADGRAELALGTAAVVRLTESVDQVHRQAGLPRVGVAQCVVHAVVAAGTARADQVGGGPSHSGDKGVGLGLDQCDRRVLPPERHAPEAPLQPYQRLPPEAQAALPEGAGVGVDPHLQNVERRQAVAQVFGPAKAEPRARGDAARQLGGASTMGATALADEAEVDQTVDGAAALRPGGAGCQAERQEE